MLVVDELRKYPVPVLERFLGAVWICDRVAVDGESIAGFSSGAGRDVYVAANLSSGPHPDPWFRRTVHHEISTAFYRAAQGALDETEWTQALPRGFTYHDSHGVTWRSTARDAWYSRRALRVTAELGFACRYGETSREEDFNTIAENLFAGTPAFWELYEEHGLLRRKVDLVVAYFHGIHGQFSTAYFQGLATAAESSRSE